MFRKGHRVRKVYADRIRTRILEKTVAVHQCALAQLGRENQLLRDMIETLSARLDGLDDKWIGLS
jgi:ubiquinone biosynthesis protein UbiJ